MADVERMVLGLPRELCREPLRRRYVFLTLYLLRSCFSSATCLIAAYLHSFMALLFSSFTRWTYTGAMIYGSALAVDDPWGSFVRALIEKKALQATWSQQVRAWCRLKQTQGSK